MNYASMSNKDLSQLIRVRAPGASIGEVDDTNRQTVIAYLGISDWMEIATIRKDRKDQRRQQRD